MKGLIENAFLKIRRMASKSLEGIDAFAVQIDLGQLLDELLELATAIADSTGDSGENAD